MWAQMTGWNPFARKSASVLAIESCACPGHSKSQVTPAHTNHPGLHVDWGFGGAHGELGDRDAGVAEVDLRVRQQKFKERRCKAVRGGARRCEAVRGSDGHVAKVQRSAKAVLRRVRSCQRRGETRERREESGEESGRAGNGVAHRVALLGRVGLLAVLPGREVAAPPGLPHLGHVLLLVRDLGLGRAEAQRDLLAGLRVLRVPRTLKFRLHQPHKIPRLAC